MPLSLEELEEAAPLLELGADRYAIQGDTGTGKSTLALNIAASYGPVMYLVLDPNVKYLGPNIREDAKIAPFKLGLKGDATLADRQELMRRINFLWNSFLAKESSPKFGEPYGAIVWDTHTLLWDFVGPLKVEERLAKGKDPNRQAGPLDWGDANAWMASLSTQHDVYRPDSCMCFVLHEKAKWVQEDRGQWVESNIMIPDAWKHTKKHVQVYLRLYRRVKGFDRNGKPKNNARTGMLEKFSPDESVPTRLGEIAEPEWQDFVELLEAYKNG